MSTTSALDSLVRDARVIVCVGSGGVGKTTTSALLALHAARNGRRVLVLTVDPARRLANALGLERMDEDLHRIELDSDEPGELWASMLDMKRAFDDLVRRHAASDQQRDQLLENRFYQFFSTSLAGAQELAASERLYEVVNSGQFDLIVLDTPPTTNALDFLDAPRRYFDAIDSAVFQWLVDAGSSTTRRSGLLGMGSALILRTLSRFTGQEFFQELHGFLVNFSELFDGFRERTLATSKLLAEPSTRFVVVTTPDPMTSDETMHFRARLTALGLEPAAMIVNRVRREIAQSGLLAAGPEAVLEALAAVEGAALLGRPVLQQLGRKLIANAKDFEQLAERDKGAVGALARANAPVPVLVAPLFATDIHSLGALDRMRAEIALYTPR
jgi:anion-transporting  ArsA/GET3 family ATPase